MVFVSLLRFDKPQGRISYLRLPHGHGPCQGLFCLCTLSVLPEPFSLLSGCGIPWVCGRRERSLPSLCFGTESREMVGRGGLENSGLWLQNSRCVGWLSTMRNCCRVPGGRPWAMWRWTGNWAGLSPAAGFVTTVAAILCIERVVKAALLEFRGSFERIEGWGRKGSRLQVQPWGVCPA